MANIKLYNMKAQEVGTVELNDELFAAPYNEPLVHQAVVTRLANERQGTKSALTRTEVRGGVENHTVKKARVMLVKVLRELHNGLKVAQYSHQSQEISLRR